MFYIEMIPEILFCRVGRAYPAEGLDSTPTSEKKWGAGYDIKL